MQHWTSQKSGRNRSLGWQHMATYLISLEDWESVTILSDKNTVTFYVFIYRPFLVRTPRTTMNLPYITWYFPPPQYHGSEILYQHRVSSPCSNNAIGTSVSSRNSPQQSPLSWPTDAWCPKIRAALTGVCGTGFDWQDSRWSPVTPGTQLVSFQASQHPMIMHASNHYSYESMCSFCLHRG